MGGERRRSGVSVGGEGGMDLSWSPGECTSFAGAVGLGGVLKILLMRQMESSVSTVLYVL